MTPTKEEKIMAYTYKQRILEKIADATYAKDYCQQKAWEFVGMREDSTTAQEYFESVKSWDNEIEKLMKRAHEEHITNKEIKNAIDKKYSAMQEEE